jgi:fibronectin type 3 domain-containing protein
VVRSFVIPLFIRTNMFVIGSTPRTSRLFGILFLLIGTLANPVATHAFVHPGGLHTLADLDRMKTNVLAGNHPWIDGWNVLIADPQAQSNYTIHATADFNANRQNADADAHAAYLNTIRWYISGDVNFANTATNILNRWAATVTTNTETGGGLSGLPTMSFALAGELLRTYSGWQPADFSAFTNMMVQYLYPPCNNYVSSQPCNFAHWTSWDAPNTAAILAIGVLCDDTNKLNQAVTLFKSGPGTAAMSNAIPYRFGTIGQPSESGRDQEHCLLGIADMGVLCQVAWNQGLDLYGYDDNRLLAGVEYLAKYNLMHEVPYTALNNCANENLWFVSGNGRARVDDRPVYEMFYNHYVVRQGLNAPYTKASAQLYRPERGSADHFGYGTLTYTLAAAAAPYPPAPLPAVPRDLTARPGIGAITLRWTPPPGDLAFGYQVLRAATSGGPYTTLASWNANTAPSYTDTSVVTGSTYYYAVTALNQSGSSAISAEIAAQAATPGALPAGWTNQDVAVVTSAGSAQYTSAGNNTFLITGAGTGIGGTGDGGFNYTYRLVTNNFTVIGRLTENNADKMGIMMRGSLATNSALVQFMMANNARQSIYGIRTSNGGNLNNYNSGAQFTWLPAWYKLVRNGNVFTAYQSDDGLNWIAVQSTTISAIPTSGYYVGLAINSGDATFDNVVFTNAAVTGAFAPPAAPTGITATAVANNLVTLSWSPVTNASGYNVKRGPGGGPYTNIVTDSPLISFHDTTTAPNTTYSYVVTAINGGGESTDSAPADAVTPGAMPPSPPAVVTATPTDTQIILNWSAVVDATGYNVKRGPNGGPYTNIVTGVVATFTDTNVASGGTYHYVVTAGNASGESANSVQASAALLPKLTGTIIGTAGSWNNAGNTKEKVFDNNLNTYFDGPTANGVWAGLDFGAGPSNVIGVIKYCPRATFASRMVGGVLQGANDPDFTNATTLFTITAAPAYNVLTPQTVSVTTAFRYVRYLSPNNGYGNVAEVEFYGRAVLPPPPAAPVGLIATAGDAQVTLSWSAASGATSYNVKSAPSASGPYTTITNVTMTNLSHTGLANGTTLYYVVTAWNPGGESANSLEVSARPVSHAPVTFTTTLNNGQLEFSWPPTHLGWRLETQTNSLATGLGTNWFNVPDSANTNWMLLPLSSDAPVSVFFRLIYP